MTNRFRHALLPFLALAMLLIGTPNATAAPGSRTDSPQAATILSLEGKVEYAVAGNETWKAATSGLKLNPGDRIRTGKEGRATIRLANRILQRLASSSTLYIEAEDSSNKTVPTLQRGSMYFQSRERPREQRFRSPLVSGAIRGTEFTLTVADDGTTTLTMIDGEVDLQNEFGTATVMPREEASIAPGGAPQKTAVLDAKAVIQWALYYPAVVDLEELTLGATEAESLQASINAYRSGDLLGALDAWPAGHTATSDSAKILRAALVLSVGQVEEAENLVAVSPVPAARAIQGLINTVRGMPNFSKSFAVEPRDSSSFALAASYQAQSDFELEVALAQARLATKLSPNFGFAWARVAELEFSFGRSVASLNALDRALELSPRNAQAHALRGFLLSARGHYTEATASFNQAIELDGALPTGWLGRGLVKIYQGDELGGREDLHTAAVLEPNRAALRSYLGKAFSHEGDNEMARKELDLAKRLDPQDPTSHLYSALLNQQENRVNQAVTDLEKSLELNETRGLYRSGLLLDKDRAVRSANLAYIYRDAGLTERSLTEAYRAIQNDPANYAAHLFLANSLNEKRDFRGVDLRYETPAISEYLVATLLAPPGAGTLAQSITAQEYSRFFAGKEFGVASTTDFFSEGQWLNVNALYGETPSLSYAVGSYYRKEEGTRPNNDLELLSLSALTKLHLTPQDSLFIQAVYTDSEAGDRAQRYNSGAGNRTVRVEESLEPTILLGYHHEWAPGSRTLALFGRLNDTFDVVDPASSPNAIPGAGSTSELYYQSTLNAYTAELQHIWQNERTSFIVGALGQFGEFDTTVVQSNIAGLPVPPFPAGTFNAQAIESDFHRVSLYGYNNWELTRNLTLNLGLSYDHVHHPQNSRNPPINSIENSRSRVSPKAGLTWTPTKDTLVRFAYTRSLGGVSIDQSFRLEPTQVAGLNQSYRSLIPETLTGALTAPALETLGLAVDQKFGKGTYVGVLGEILKSDVDNTAGAYLASFAGGTLTPVNFAQELEFKEKAISAYANQLFADYWSVGATYRVAVDELDRLTPATGLIENFEGTLHQAKLFLLFNHPSGFFTRAESLWRHQSNQGFAPAQPGDQFWQHNLLAGYRFARRRAEIQIGILNLADQNYQLNPLNPHTELPRERTFTARLRLNF